MCGIREVYFVSQDPFWFDRVVFELWLQGLSVQEALAHRLNRVHISEQQQLLPLLQIDTAHNYHVFDLLEGSLRRPEGFLTFSPLQIRTNERKEILRGYYSLQSTIAREVAKVGRSANHRIVIKMLVQKTNLRVGAVRRQVENIYRTYQRLRVQEDTEKQLEEALGSDMASLYIRISFILHHKIDIKSKRCANLTFKSTDSVLFELYKAHPTLQNGIDIPQSLMDIARAVNTTFSRSTHFDTWRYRLLSDGVQARFTRTLEEQANFKIVFMST
eukprot:GHVS01027310.1.p1 GENE.GHVS01027310.1~~GHVS01027310.1.p1  ORF type:complete len:273 (+),score=25.52 GHVS01027310.1:2-820(+)